MDDENYIGYANVIISIVKYSDNTNKFNAKIVFENLEEELKKLGHEITSAETRENGRHTPLALRIFTKSQYYKRFTLELAIYKVDQDDGVFNTKITLDNLEGELEKRNIKIESASTSIDGKKTPYGIRVKI